MAYDELFKHDLEQKLGLLITRLAVKNAPEVAAWTALLKTAEGPSEPCSCRAERTGATILEIPSQGSCHA